MREAMEKALAAMERMRSEIEDWGGYANGYFQDKHDLQGDLAAADFDIAALRAALAAPQEPVAWMQADQPELYVKEYRDDANGYTIPLYAAPAAQPRQVVVPAEATEAMLDAAEKLVWFDEDPRGNFSNIWHVMLAAAQEGKP